MPIVSDSILLYKILRSPTHTLDNVVNDKITILD
jgi:hypothetical protein